MQGTSSLVHSFSPSSVSVKRCQPIKVTNKDTFNSHTWTGNPGPFDSGNLDLNQSYGYMFTVIGRFDFVCSYHPEMTGTITVS